MLSLSDLKRFFLPWKFLRNHTSDNADSGDEDHHDSNNSPSTVSSPSHHRSMTSGPIASLTGPRPSSAPVLTSISLSHPNQRLSIPDSSFHSPPSIASKSPVFSFSSNNLYHLNSPLTTSTCSSRGRSSPSLSLSYTFSHPSFSPTCSLRPSSSFFTQGSSDHETPFLNEWPEDPQFTTLLRDVDDAIGDGIYPERIYQGTIESRSNVASTNGILQTSDAGSQYHCGWVGRGIQPPSTPQVPHSHTQNASKTLVFALFDSCSRTDGPTDRRTDRQRLL